MHLGVEIRPDLPGRLSLAVLAAEAASDPTPEPEAAGDEADDKAAPADSAKRKTKPARRGQAVQGSLSLDGTGKGRFRDLTPTLYGGEDLDIPTFIRRGIPRPKI